MQHSPRRLLPALSTLIMLLVLAPIAYAATATQNKQTSETGASTAPVKNGVSRVHVTLSGDKGGACLLDYNTAQAGPITFLVTNETATAITEVELLSNHRILGEKENLAPGLPTVSFTVKLDGGNYNFYCPGAQQEMQAFAVTGHAVQAVGNTAELFQKGAQGYAHYVQGMTDAMVTAVARLKKYIDAGDLDKARAQYPESRIFYERIESDVEGFVLPGYKVTDNAGSLDYLIDMRTSNLDPAVGWHGFHAIERDLFKYNRIDDGTKQSAAELLKNVKRLRKVAYDLEFKPLDLANGAAALLEEVLGSKVTGEEEEFSHYDLVDFAGNVEGARQAFAFLKPGLKEIDPELTQKVTNRFKAVEKTLDQYRDPDVPGGFVVYTAEVQKANAAKLSRSIQTLQEPLARLATKVATAGI